VLFYGQEVGTSLGFVPSFKEHGLGTIDPQLAEVTRQSVETYMGIKNIPPAKELYTNQFVGSVKLTPAEWAAVEQRVKKSCRRCGDDPSPESSSRSTVKPQRRVDAARASV